VISKSLLVLIFISILSTVSDIQGSDFKLEPSCFDLRNYGLSQPHRIFALADNPDSAYIDTTSNGNGFRPLHDLAYGVKATLTDAVHVYSSPIRIDGNSALWLLGFAGAGGLIYIYDREIYDALKERTEHKALKPIVKWGDNTQSIGDGGKSAKYYFGGVILGYVTGIDKLFHVSSDVLESYLIAGLIKNAANYAAGRSRPHEGGNARFWKQNEGTSFPSGHAANVIQLARIFSHHFNYVPVKIACYGTAGCVAVQRVTSDSHWPSDVYTALLYGWFVADEVVKRNHARRFRVHPSRLSDGTPALGIAVSF